ncbi:unnamed protein product [Calypogeia fissa]
MRKSELLGWKQREIDVKRSFGVGSPPTVPGEMVVLDVEMTVRMRMRTYIVAEKDDTEAEEPDTSDDDVGGGSKEDEDEEEELIVYNCGVDSGWQIQQPH